MKQAYRHRDRMGELIRTGWRDIVLVDVLFIGLFLMWVGVRWANPDLWHPFMGGEKPMDFAYFNAVMRSTRSRPMTPGSRAARSTITTWVRHRRESHEAPNRSQRGLQSGCPHALCTHRHRSVHPGEHTCGRRYAQRKEPASGESP